MAGVDTTVFYRQFMYIIAYRAFVAIIRGKRQGWNKLQRSGRLMV